MLEENAGFDPDDEGLPPPTAARILNVKPATLATWRSQGRGPRFRKIGRSVEYPVKFLKEFREAAVRSPEPASVRRQRRAEAAEAKAGAQ